VSSASADTRAPRAPFAARLALGLIALTAALIGIPASFAPESFYERFPFFAEWVSLLPPYNEHLVTDVGGLYLGFAVVFAWGALTLSRELVLAACAGWAVAALAHLVFHITNLAPFGAADAIAQTAGLALALGLPALAVWAVGPRR